MHKSLLTALFLLCILTLSAQDSDARKSKAVIASSGDQYTGGNVQLNWTIGEVAITAVKSDRNLLTQGYHQGKYSIQQEFVRNLLEYEVNVFPNPTTDHVNIHIADIDRKMVVELYDLHGRLLLSAALSEQDNLYQLDMRALDANAYILKMTSLDSEFISTYNIIKTK